jgi:serine protease AprX
MSAAVISGVAAQVLSARPTLSPDRLKYLLSATARPVASNARTDVGSGIIDAYATLRSTKAGVANVGLARSSGLGSLAGSRGTMLVQTQDAVPVVLDGVYTAQLLVWDPVGFTTGDWTASTWNTPAVRAVPWSPTRWYGWKWEGWKWEGASWYGQPVDSGSYGSRGEGSAWYGAWS